MTVATTGYTNSYTGNGATTTFTFNKWLRDKSDLVVTVDGNVQTITTHYTIAGTGPYPTGEDVVFVTAPANGEVVLLTRVTPDTQDVNFSNAGNFDQESIELALDKAIANLQESGGILNDAVLVPTSLSGSNITLGAPTASELLAWDSGATTIESSGYTVASIAADVAATAADVVLTNADVVLTGLDVVSTNADVALTNADVVSTNADVVSTNADVVLTGLDVVAAAASAAQAATTASNLSGTLSGNYILPSNPSVDGNNRFTVVEQMKAYMEANDQAFIPTSGLTVTWHAWLFNGTNSTWKTQGCKIESDTYSIEANNTDLGTGLIDIDHDDGAPLYLYYSVAKNKVIVTKYVGV